jgi:hypothetical protein
MKVRQAVANETFRLAAFAEIAAAAAAAVVVESAIQHFQ